MNAAACNTTQPIPSLFGGADAQFAKIKTTLTSQDFEDKTEAEVQRWLAVEHREVMRLLHQAYITVRSQEKTLGPVVGADGVPRTHVRKDKTRDLETVFGTVQVERTGYSGRNLSTLYPVDANLNLPKNKYSLEVDRQVAMAAARMSFDESLEMLSHHMAGHIPKRQAEEAVRRAARNYEAFYASTEIELDRRSSNLLVLTFDQKGVVLHSQDLNEATRKAAENSPTKMSTRRSKGETKRGRKRMAAVAAVYTIAPHHRTAEDVVLGLRRIRVASIKLRPKPEGKRTWATLTRNMKDVIAEAFDEAQDRDPRHHKRWLALVDGDAKLAKWVRSEARRRGIDITVVLDFIHALEYLWKAAHVFFEEGTPEIEAWVLERLQRMLEGDISHVVAGMTRMATLRGLKKHERAPVDRAAKYLLKRKDMMRYDDLLSIGAPIATGVIEGACRHLINDRMDLTGARWRLPTAEAVLKLRSIVSSGDFEEYWKFHEEQEAHQNHQSRYANDCIPATTPPRGPKLRIVKTVD